MTASSILPTRPFETEALGPPPKMDDERKWPLDVVIVDDDDDTLAMLVKILTRFGHFCRVASNAVDATSLLRERRADVILCDWEMPGPMNGIDLCKHVRSLYANRYTYFMLVTGMDDHARLREAMEIGADEYLKKPLDLDVLEARLILASRVIGTHRRFEKQADKLRRDSRHLYKASHTDTLTGVGSRLAFEEELVAALSRKDRYGRGASIAICDVDLFKQYNDRFGHVAGDEALRKIGHALRDHLRASDHVYRYGGEEFVVLLPEQNIDEASYVMERIKDEIVHLTIPAPTQSGILTISAGVAEIEPADESGATWLERADQALYRAKMNGRNRVERATKVPPPPDEVA